MAYEKTMMVLRGDSNGILRLEADQDLRYSVDYTGDLSGADLLLFTEKGSERLTGTKGIESSWSEGDKIFAAAVVRDGRFLLTGQTRSMDWAKERERFALEQMNNERSNKLEQTARALVKEHQAEPDAAPVMQTQREQPQVVAKQEGNSQPMEMEEELPVQEELRASQEDIKWEESLFFTPPQEADRMNEEREGSREKKRRWPEIEEHEENRQPDALDFLQGIAMQAGYDEESDRDPVSIQPHATPTHEQEPPCFEPDKTFGNPFSHIFREANWRTVKYPLFGERGYYLAGEIFKSGQKIASAIAVPGKYDINPPGWLKGFDTYLNEASGTQGYWILLRDMDGQLTTIQRIVSR